MATKRQLAAYGRKGAQTRKYNLLLADGFTSEEIEDRRLNFRSFESGEMQKLRTQRKAYVAEGYEAFPNIRDPQERRQVAVAYALQFRDARFRLERLRETRLYRDGFTRAEITVKRLELIPFSHPVMQLARRRRRGMILAEITKLLPRGQKRSARTVLEEGGALFIRARELVVRQDETALLRLGKDHPMRLLDLVSP